MPKNLTERREAAANVIRESAEKWSSGYVARREISQFTGGVLAPRTMANLDSLGRGPEGAFKIGRSVAYPLGSLTDWLIERLEV